jgi:hypothetical protein
MARCLRVFLFAFMNDDLRISGGRRANFPNRALVRRAVPESSHSCNATLTVLVRSIPLTPFASSACSVVWMRADVRED